MIRQLYDRVISLAAHRHALWFLALISFAESSFFPIPPDLLMIPMILARPSRAFIIASVAVLASVLGGLAGYFIGAVLFETIGQPILAFYGKETAFTEMSHTFNSYGAWAVLIAGITPFPYKVITIFSGVTNLSLPIFIVSSVIARGLRFFIVALLLWKFGSPIRDFIERRLGLIFTLFIIILVAGFWAVKFL